MSQSPITIPILESRLSETERRIAELEAHAEKYRSAIASLRAIEQFFEEDEMPVAPVGKVAPLEDRPSPTKLGPPRPEGIPTNFEMARMILTDAEMDGKPGLTAVELVGAIGKRYWPGLQPQQILPMMYQFAKGGRLDKGNDGVFRLPKKIEASDEKSVADASEASGHLTDSQDREAGPGGGT